MSNKILIVDDDNDVLSTLYKVIKANAMEPFTASSGETALKMLERDHYDLVLLDINMTGIDGFEVIKRVREKDLNTPIIVLTARTDDYDALYGLEIGADDYITKPYNPITLGAKVKAMIRRSQRKSSDDDILIVGPFKYNNLTLKLYKNDVEIPLSSKENAIVRLFLDNVNHVYPKEVLYEAVWGNEVFDDNAIMVYISKLRQKLEDDPSEPRYIQTARGLGYRFVIPE